MVTASRFGILCIIQFTTQLNSSSLFMPLIGLFNLLASLKSTQQNIFLKVELFLKQSYSICRISMIYAFY